MLTKNTCKCCIYYQKHIQTWNTQIYTLMHRCVKKSTYTYLHLKRSWRDCSTDSCSVFLTFLTLTLILLHNRSLVLVFIVSESWVFGRISPVCYWKSFSTNEILSSHFSNFFQFLFEGNIIGKIVWHLLQIKVFKWLKKYESCRFICFCFSATA